MPPDSGTFKKILAPANMLLPVLLALVPAVLLFRYFPLQLQAIQNGMLGAAGMEGVDVGRRINRFYYTGFVFAGGLVLWSYLYHKLITARLLSRASLVYVSISAALALSCGTFQLMAGAATFSLFYAFTTSTLLLFLVGIWAKQRQHVLTWPAVAGAWMLGWSMMILLMDVAHMTGCSLQHGWVYGALAFGAVLCGLTLFKPARQAQWLYGLTPFLFIPCLYVLSTELFLVLNQRGIYLTTPSAFYLLGLLALVVWCILRWRSRATVPATRKLLSAMAGITAAGVFLSGLYVPILSELPTEHFEMANRANAIMQLFRFQQVPFAEYYSSHLLDDQLPGIVYTLLNGYKANLDFLVYHALVSVVYQMFIFWFFKAVFRDALLALFLLIIFPFAIVLVPPYCSVALVVWMAMMHYFRKPSLASFLLLACTGLFLMSWRLDVAVGALPAIAILVLLQVVRARRWKPFLLEAGQALLIIGVPLVLIIGYCGVVLHIPIWQNAGDALDYIKASQAHAIPDIFVGSAFWQSTLYFILPLSIMVLLYRVWQRKGVSAQQQLQYFALVFLALYYLFSFQRGLVRHVFGVEGSDTFLVSFLLLILALGWYALTRAFAWKKWTLVLVMLVLVAGFKYPGVPGLELPAEAALQTVSHRKEVENAHELIPRAPGYAAIAGQFDNIQKTMDSNFVADATFLDFSHTPMLYYYLQRKVPGYFCQYMQNMVTDKIQRHNITQLQNMNVPLVVFSSWPLGSFWDNVDGLNNAVRYYVVSNYIFNHYQPLGLADGKYLWVKKGIAIQHNYTGALADSVLFERHTDRLAKLAHYWANGVNSIYDDKAGAVLQATGVGQWQLPDAIGTADGNLLLLELHNSSADWTQVECAYADSLETRGAFTFEVAPNQTGRYLVPLSTQYNWHTFNIQRILLHNLPEGIQVKKIMLHNRL